MTETATEVARSGPYAVERDREFRCGTCGSRCTRGSAGVEYGHKYRCPERPDHLPKAGLGSASYYSGGGSA